MTTTPSVVTQLQLRHSRLLAEAVIVAHRDRAKAYELLDEAEKVESEVKRLLDVTRRQDR